MATQNGIGDILTLTNTDTASHLTITDVSPAIHIPASGSVALPFTGDVAESYFNGVIRGFMGGAKGLYGTTSGVNATGNHPTKLTAAFSESWNAGQVTEYGYVTMTAPDNATQRVYWSAPNKAITITEIAVNVPVISAEAGTLITTAQKVAGTKNLLGAANYDIATAGGGPDITPANTYTPITLTNTAADLQVAAGGAIWIQVVSNDAGMNTSDFLWRITYTVD